MKASLRACFLALSPLAIFVLAPVASAEEYIELELTIPVSLVDRSTAGVAGAPSGYGYENDAGLGLGADARLYWTSSSDFFAQGFVVSTMQQAGPAMSAGGVAFHTVYVDVGYTARAIFPCMSGGNVRWQLAGILAVTGAYADAGTGVGGEPNGPDSDERERVSDELDHGGIGWRLAVDMSWHVDQFVVGVGLGGRQYFAIDSPVARVWTMDVGMRFGGRFDFGGRSSYGYPDHYSRDYGYGSDLE